MSTSATRSSTFTLTEARYIGGKISADLRLLNAYYGHPTLGTIDDYAEEAALLLRDGYLKTIDFGFKDDDGAWRLRLRYTVTAGGQLVDDRPGQLPAHLATEEFSFYSFLSYSPAFFSLTPEQRAGVKAGLPIDRTPAAEPTTGPGTTTSGHGYSAGGTGVARNVYTAL